MDGRLLDGEALHDVLDKVDCTAGQADEHYQIQHEDCATLVPLLEVHKPVGVHHANDQHGDVDDKDQGVDDADYCVLFVSQRKILGALVTKDHV